MRGRSGWYAYVPKLSTIVPKLGATLKTGGGSTALFGKTRGSVLALLFGHPDEPFYVRQIIRAVGSGQGSVQRELRSLTAIGILRRRVEGHQVYYQANRESPVFAELQGLMMKTVGMVDVLRASLAVLSERIAVAFIYGSIAKGTATGDSDVDVLVVGSATFAEVVSALQPAQEQLGREVNPSVYPVAEFRRKMAEGSRFLGTVAREGRVYVLGGERELADLVAERLAD